MTPREEFRDYLLRFLHIQYKWGGSNPLQGLDCSGHVQIMLDYLMIDPPGDQTADALYRWFASPARGVIVQQCDLGVLAFFGGRTISHVGIGLDRLRMVEAGGGGSGITNREEAARVGACVRVSRVSRRSDLVALIEPLGMSW